MRRVLFLLATLTITLLSAAQKEATSCHCPAMTTTGKGTLYGSLGFHRIFFTRSDIHFRNDNFFNYDFTLYNVKAKDDNDLNIGKGIAAPQYSVRIGYIFNNVKGNGLEFSYEHAKYIAVQDQQVRIRGQINGKALDKDTVLSKDFIEYDHTDGANYYMLSFVKRKPLLHSKDEKHWLSLTLKPGAGIVLPRTDSRIMGFSYNEKYHLSGYVIGMEGSVRYDFLKNFYSELGAKTAYANYTDILLYGDGRAKQRWFSLQVILVVGFQVPL